MGSLTLYTSSLGSYYYFKENVLEYLAENDPQSFLYLLPVNRSVRYLKKQLVIEAGQKSILDPHIYTFRSFIRELYNRFPEKKKIISPSMRLLLIQHILNNEKHELEYFQKSGAFGNGIILKTDQMLDEFFQFGFRPGDFDEPPPTAETKYSDFNYLVSSLFEIYRNDLIDESSLMGETFAFLERDSILNHFRELNKVYISGFGIYSPPMYRLIEILKGFCDIEIKLEYSDKNTELFRHTADAYEKLSMMSDQVIPVEEEHSEFNHLIFNSKGSADQFDTLPLKIDIKKVHNRIDEISLIASSIKYLHHVKEIPLHKIGITFPNVEKYVPHIKQLFKEYDLPFNLSTGFILAESPLIQSFMQILRVVMSGFQTNEVYKLAISPFLKNTLLDEANLIHQSAQKIRIDYLSGNWQERIKSLIQPDKDEDLLTHIFPKIPEDQLVQMLENVSELIQLVKPLDNKLAPEKFQFIYTDVLKSLGLMTWYNEDSMDLEISEREKEYRAFNRFIKLMDQIVWILKYLHGDRLLEIKDYYDVLTIIFENATYNLREWSDYGVQIMPRLEILSLDLETLFIGGLIEGDFPRHFTRDIFFNDDERDHIGLNASEDLLSQDRFLFFQLLTGGAKNVILSYPQFESESELLPSTFLTNLKEMTPSLESEDNLSDDIFQSRSSLPEHISKMLKSGLVENDKQLYSAWLDYESPEKMDYWYKGIRSQFKRRSYRDVTAFEGNLTDSGAVHREMEESYLHRPFSITALESYAFCPMQFFLQRIMRLEGEEEISSTITSLERGNLIHKILYKFYQQLKPEERIKPWESIDLLKTIATETFNSLPYNDIIWQIEKEKYFGNEERKGLWDKFLETEKEYLQQTGFIPSFFEADFGSRKKNKQTSYSSPFVIKHKKGDIKITGIIDRIDIDTQSRFNVIDYKTGQGAMKIKTSDMVEGASLQIPIYIAAAKHLLKIRGKTGVPGAGMYYQVQDEENCKTSFILVNHESGIELPQSKRDKKPQSDSDIDESNFNAIIEKSLEHVSHYVDGMSNGNFQHTNQPQDNKCKSYCDFKRICRKDIGKLIALQE